MINQQQSREYNRTKKLQKYLSETTTVYENYEPFAEEALDFNKNSKSFEDLVPDKNHTGTGITTDKTGLKHTVSDALERVCKKSYSYALKYNNPQLAALVNTTADKIFKIKDAALLGFVNTIIEAITPLLADANFIKYGITADQLNAIAANANSFNSLIGAASVTDSENTVANTAINKVIEQIHENIKHFDLLVDEFAESNPGFVQGYHLNSTIDNTGMRHSGIEGYVRNKNGEAIVGAKVKLQGTLKTATTDLKGYYHIERTDPQDYMVECSAEGYTTQTKLHHISRGKTDEMDWELAAV